MSKYIPAIICLLAILILMPVGCTSATKDTTGFAKITDVQTTQARAMPGQPAPIICWIGSDNVSHSMIEFKGKSVLINTWNVNCVECGPEFPYFQEIVDRYSPEGLVFFSINTLDASNSTREYLANKKCNFTVLLDADQLIYKKFVLPKTANPYTFFIDPDGVLAYIQIGPFKSSDEIRAILTQYKMIK